MTAQQPPKRRITLIGEVHTDPLLPERMYAALTSLRPDSISVEHTLETYQKEQEWAYVLAQPEAREQIERRVVELGWRDATFDTLRTILAGTAIAIDRYRSERFADLAFVEDPAFIGSELYWQHVESSHQLIDELIREAAVPESAEELYACSSDEEPLTEQTITAYRRRDAYAERIIRSLHGSLVHFGGLDHVFGPYENLAWRLRDLEPRVRELQEFDLLEL